ncbi:flagellar basal body L-ring protein FlgH [Saccharospirillum salsuginis]|uniref:Flagellar L-ring protein n=1 Tax=Saccharospirillum salsuginis TaxID=418750 RepID=A0A918K5F6_9GAMM|nr:flagellar basal body L-ring protein FlgH [Saccharospirillum salsuginis]GGX50558.1 flagellar L-ring protein [Saccharospirillum salsuginis]
MIKRSLILILASLALAGCGTLKTATVGETPVAGDPEFAPVPSESLKPPPNQDGSLFTPRYGMSLYGDKKAMRVGDIITVVLNEETQGSKSSQSRSSKTSEAGLNAPVIAGGQPIEALSATIQGERSFEGRGDADQSNSLTGNISVTVAEVLPNGVLRVQGEKWITLNTGAEFIRIKGMLRPEDINLDNTVSSQKLADARITYSGAGALADANQPGWLTKFFNSPVFPF